MNVVGAVRVGLVSVGGDMYTKENNLIAVKKYQSKNPWVKSYYHAKWRCKKCQCYGIRGISFSLSMDECIKLWFRDKAYLLDSPSLDRVDTNSSYEYSNCRFIELSVNKSRQKAKSLKKNPTSKFKGVHWDSNRKEWVSQVRHNKKSECVYFDNELEAAKDYNNKVRVIYKEDAVLNKV